VNTLCVVLFGAESSSMAVDVKTLFVKCVTVAVFQI